MNGRRTFLKTLVGAFVASAIEIRLIAEPAMKMEAGHFRAVMTSLQEVVREAWVERYNQAYRDMI